ncbi:hypothetical protein PV416_14690 [Streptomyces ipomoeae]|jgi:hypothetical protein|uniref:hypothetical protein n=1 Tax=Streptomyces ipomoeae TaxID=103232 RepID=UPI000662BDDC|nr:hypothetical protein [Streptomyces ipomoeae]MDX2699301.1 hypothetical protein [Streptomyces ipomoeae]MDX2822314.1 hypothetical protein [Streptomyces ipomoeae]MDX2845007.1 hypothetical protein [Streptomyces ipomoeae]MDX2875015.1 hypothetical protein [Streptomyces ipomoeae]MDX2936255.1 hypothetical protein [Streptomyces ipomoeae]
MAVSAHLTPQAGSLREAKPYVPEARDPEPHFCVFSAEGACVEAPLTSEPPLPDAEPLTSEPPLTDAAHLTSEPTSNGAASGV